MSDLREGILLEDEKVVARLRMGLFAQNDVDKDK